MVFSATLCGLYDTVFGCLMGQLTTHARITVTEIAGHLKQVCTYVKLLRYNVSDFYLSVQDRSIISDHLYHVSPQNNQKSHSFSGAHSCISSRSILHSDDQFPVASGCSEHINGFCATNMNSCCEIECMVSVQQVSNCLTRKWLLL